MRAPSRCVLPVRSVATARSAARRVQRDAKQERIGVSSARLDQVKFHIKYITAHTRLLKELAASSERLELRFLSSRHFSRLLLVRAFG